jgi:hypothetical protein
VPLHFLNVLAITYKKKKINKKQKIKKETKDVHKLVLFEHASGY